MAKLLIEATESGKHEKVLAHHGFVPTIADDNDPRIHGIRSYVHPKTGHYVHLYSNGEWVHQKAINRDGNESDGYGNTHNDLHNYLSKLK